MKATPAEIRRALYPRSKYGAKRHNGYASKREANVAAQLQALQRAGQIHDLREQVRYEVLPKQIGHIRHEKALSYVADFVWLDKADIEHVADAKGVRTRLYILKRALMKFRFGIEVEEF
jgi:hypothetical protein